MFPAGLRLTDTRATSLGDRTITVEAENGRVVVVITAVAAADDADPVVPAQETAILAVSVSGSRTCIETTTISADGTCSLRFSESREGFRLSILLEPYMQVLLERLSINYISENRELGR